MKTLIIYTSQTGFNKRYAEWLAEEMGARIDHSYDIADKKYLGPVVAYLKEANNEAYSA